jgi:hypothetical protein
MAVSWKPEESSGEARAGPIRPTVPGNAFFQRFCRNFITTGIQLQDFIN